MNDSMTITPQGESETEQLIRQNGQLQEKVQRVKHVNELLDQLTVKLDKLDELMIGARSMVRL